jgi:hypothetical protein
MSVEEMAGTDCLVMTRDRGADRRGVIAVVVERHDQSCTLY